MNNNIKSAKLSLPAKVCNYFNSSVLLLTSSVLFLTSSDIFTSPVVRASFPLI